MDGWMDIQTSTYVPFVDDTPTDNFRGTLTREIHYNKTLCDRVCVPIYSRYKQTLFNIRILEVHFPDAGSEKCAKTELNLYSHWTGNLAGNTPTRHYDAQTLDNALMNMKYEIYERTNEHIH